MARSLTKGEFWIGTDLGGTRVRVALSDQKGRFLEKVGEKVDKSCSSAVSDQIVRLARYLCNRQGLNIRCVKGIGIASTGPIIQEKGVLFKPNNLPFDCVPLTRPITEELGVPSCLLNDCGAAALGEKTFGVAKDLDNFVYVTISTGIGAGAFVNGTLLSGKDGNAHELGHIVIDCEGKLTCTCGRRGHWEAYCSGVGIPNFVRMKLENLPEKTVKTSLLFKRMKGDLSTLVAADLFAAAREADDLSLKLVNDVGILNAMGFANVTNIYDPSLITVGGTVALRNKRMILRPIRKYIEHYAINRISKIVATPLGDDIGLYGAVAAAQESAR